MKWMHALPQCWPHSQKSCMVQVLTDADVPSQSPPSGKVSMDLNLPSIVTGKSSIPSARARQFVRKSLGEKEIRDFPI